MDFEVLRQAVCVNELIYEGSVEQSVDSDLTLQIGRASCRERV